MAKGKRQGAGKCSASKRTKSKTRLPKSGKRRNGNKKNAKAKRENPAKESSGLQNVLTIFLVGTLIAFGGLPEWVSAAVSIGLLAWLFFQARKSKELVYPRSFGFMALCLLPIFAGITLFYAVDRGEALQGVIKFLPLPLFAMAAGQQGAENRKQALEIVPTVAVGMTIVSIACVLTPAKEFFFQANRMGGFFQYPNAYGLLLLVAIVILCHRPAWRKREIGEMLICIAGIILTGSRSVFIMLAIYLVIAVVTRKALRKQLLAICAAAMGSMAVALILTGNVQSFGRILTAFGQNSTFWGRLLYARDALSMIREFPMGMGYRGYYFAQGSFQTGNYVVKHVHNELLQCALDFGILCAVCMAAAVGISLFSKRISMLQRTILIMIALHSLFDFDLQFLAMDMILILCMDLGEPGAIRRKGLIRVLRGIGGVLLALQVYGFLFLGLEAAGARQAAMRIYPGLTLSQAEWMQMSQEQNEREQLADRILARNDYCAAAYKVKARAAVERQDFTAMERYARQAIERDPYNVAVYKDYIGDISLALDHYVRAGDQEKTLEFLRKGVSVNRLARQAEARASALAFKIKDQPTIQLPDAYDQYLKELAGLLEGMEEEGQKEDAS